MLSSLALLIALLLPNPLSWVAGLALPKLLPLIIGPIVRVIMDVLKRNVYLLDKLPSWGKQMAVIVIGLAVAAALAAIQYTVPGCSLATPDGCDLTTWTDATWNGVIGAIFAMVLKASQQAKAAASKPDARGVAPARI